MENKEDIIIEEIRDSLINYELPYEEGAWERFREKQQGTELISIPFKDIKVSFISIRRIMALAASLILLISTISVFKAYNSDVQSEISKVEEVDSINNQGEKDHESLSDIAQERSRGDEIKVHNDEVKVYNTRIEQRESEIGDLEKNNVSIIATPEMEVSVVDQKGFIKENGDIGETESVKVDSIKKEINLISPLGNLESAVLLSENIRKNEDDEKWKFGVELSSSFISDKMNYGGGVFTERRLSDKVSLTSGLVFTKINAANDMKPVGISSSTRKVGVESSMQALDIPLSIVYQVSDGFYASMGVSLLTVLNENKSYQYETDMVSESFVKDPKTGVESTVYSTITRQYSEPVKETDPKGSNNIGYFNLSIGKKQSFYGKTQLLLEPFLKVPVGKPSDKEVKLMNAGLKIKVMF